MRQFKFIIMRYDLARMLYYLTVIFLIFVIFFLLHTRYTFNINATIEYCERPAKHTRNPKKTSNKYLKIINSKTLQAKYILLWTSPNTSPFVYLGKGNTVFVKKKCKWTNCYVTSDRNFFGDYTEFDAVAFHGPELAAFLKMGDLPRRRSVHQKYIYANIESAATYPICNRLWNGFFNWTWTYKLNSDSSWGYIVVKNATNHVVGPNINMHWIKQEDMDPISEELRFKLMYKVKAAAWFASNCQTPSQREEFVRQVQEHLRKYNLIIDIYGPCGKSQCPKEIMGRCLQMLETKYFFYFAFENALSEDYVTEKLLIALKHYTVPVVFGGANYSRFMPDGMYLNALELGPKRLAERMHEIMQDPQAYYDYFRWRKYYSYHYKHESPDTDDYCRFCAVMNNDSLIATPTVYDRFDLWWTPKNVCH